MEDRPQRAVRVKLINKVVVGGKHVEYHFKVQGIQKRSFTIIDRYSNMRKIYEKLKKQIKHFKKNLGAKFPKKNIWGEGFVKDRENKLENFWNALLSDEEYSQHTIVKEYLSKFWDPSQPCYQVFDMDPQSYV